MTYQDLKDRKPAVNGNCPECQKSCLLIPPLQKKPPYCYCESCHKSFPAEEGY